MILRAKTQVEIDAAGGDAPRGWNLILVYVAMEHTARSTPEALKMLRPVKEHVSKSCGKESQKFAE